MKVCRLQTAYFLDCVSQGEVSDKQTPHCNEGGQAQEARRSGRASTSLQCNIESAMTHNAMFINGQYIKTTATELQMYSPIIESTATRNNI